MVERLTSQTLDLEVRDSSLARRVVSLDKGRINGYWRHTMDFRSDHGRVEIHLGMLDAKVIRYKLQPFGPLVRVRLYLYCSLMKFVLNLLQNSTGAFCV